MGRVCARPRPRQCCDVQRGIGNEPASDATTTTAATGTRLRGAKRRRRRWTARPCRDRRRSHDSLSRSRSRRAPGRRRPRLELARLGHPTRRSAGRLDAHAAAVGLASMVNGFSPGAVAPRRSGKCFLFHISPRARRCSLASCCGGLAMCGAAARLCGTGAEPPDSLHGQAPPRRSKDHRAWRVHPHGCVFGVGLEHNRPRRRPAVRCSSVRVGAS